MDILLLYFASFGILLLLLIGFMIGRIMDIFWRAKILRQITKRDYGIAAIVNKDNKTIKTVLQDFGNDSLDIGEEKWMTEKGHIFRFDKREKGTFIKADTTKFWEGVPIIFLDHDHIIPCDLYPSEGSTKPIEISAWLSSYVANQLQKGGDILKKLATFQTLLYIAIGLALLSLVLGWYNHQDIGSVHGDILAIKNVMITPIPGGLNGT